MTFRNVRSGGHTQGPFLFHVEYQVQKSSNKGDDATNRVSKSVVYGDDR